MEPPAALALVAMVVLCLGYLLPQFVRERQELAEVASEARSVWGSRVIRRVRPRAAGRSTQALLPAVAMNGSHEMQRPVTSRPSAPRIAGSVSAPAIAAGPKAARPTAHRPQPAPRQGTPRAATPPGTSGRHDGVPREIRARRARAARCRAALAGSLALLALTGWVLVGVGAMLWWAPAIPTAMMVGVVAIGRQAALTQARADIARYGRISSAQVRSRAAAASGARPVRTAAKAASVKKSNPQVRAGQSTPRSAQVRAAEREAASAALPAPAPITEAELGAVLIAEGIPASPGDGLELVLDGDATRDDGALRLETGELAVRVAHRLPAAAAVDDGEHRDAEAGEAGPDGPTSAAARRAGGRPAPAPDRAWTPTPIPAPAYTLREQAERWEPKPLTDEDYEAAREAVARLTAAIPEDTGRIALPPRVIFGSSAIDIDTAINKRRAAGQ